MFEGRDWPFRDGGVALCRGWACPSCWPSLVPSVFDCCCSCAFFHAAAAVNAVRAESDSMDVGEAGDAGDVVPGLSPVAESFSLAVFVLVAVSLLVAL